MKSLNLVLFATVIFAGHELIADAPAVKKEVHHDTTAHHHAPHAHDEKPLVIVTINTKKIIEESVRGQEIQKKIGDEQTSITASFPAMESNIKSKDAQIAQQQNNYNEKVKSLEVKSKMLSEDARNKEVDDLQDIRRQIEELTAERERLIRKFNEEAKKAEQRLEQMYRKEMAAFEIEIREVIEMVTSLHSWDIVLTREAIIFASDRTDKTSIIITELNKKDAQRKATQAVEKKAVKAQASTPKKAA